MKSILTHPSGQHSFFVLHLDYLNFLAILNVNSEFIKRSWVQSQQVQDGLMFRNSQRGPGEELPFSCLILEYLVRKRHVGRQVTEQMCWFSPERCPRKPEAFPDLLPCLCLNHSTYNFILILFAHFSPQGYKRSSKLETMVCLPCILSDWQW